MTFLFFIFKINLIQFIFIQYQFDRCQNVRGYIREGENDEFRNFQLKISQAPELIDNILTVKMIR